MANENVIDRKSKSITLRDGKEYIVKPLPIDDLIDIWPIIVRLEKAQDEVTVDLLQDMKVLAYKALKVTNEDVQETDIGKLVDLKDLQEIIKILVGQIDGITG